jgi:hypothetical protein
MGLALSLPVLAMALAAAVGPSEEFQRGRTAFLRGEYQRAITTIRPLLYPDLRLESEDEVTQAHRLLGVSYLFEKQPEMARTEFRKLLELDPDFRFDPILDPPRVVEFFNEVIREQQSELGDIEARLKKREAALAHRRVQVLERRIERRSFALNFFPFGVGQFQNQQHRKGLFFLGVEGALAATSVAAFALNFGLYGVNPRRPCLDDPVAAQPDGSGGECPADRIDHTGEHHSRDLTRIQIASGGLFFAVAIWGVVDAIRNYQSEVTIGETLAEPPPTTSLRIDPLLTPLAQGASVTLTF